MEEQIKNYIRDNGVQAFAACVAEVIYDGNINYLDLSIAIDEALQCKIDGMIDNIED